MTRTALSRLAAAAALVAALVTALTIFSGSGLAQGQSAAAQYQYGTAPHNTAAPSISGTAQVGQTLTANNGTWTGDPAPTFADQWQRCDTAGANCAAISGATAATYTAQTADAGKTLRVSVTATNSSGSTSASSAQTAVVSQAGPEGAIKLQSGRTSIPATSVTLPERLIIDGVRFTPSRLTSRAAFVGRFHVSDTRGNVVRDSLVLVTGLPYAWARTGAEVRTDVNGWATVTIAPTINMPLFHRNALVMFVRARVEGQSLLAGSSTRRLVQITIR